MMHVLLDMSILAKKIKNKKKYRTPKTESTELKKVNKLKGASDDASVSLRREKKGITRGEKWTWVRKGTGHVKQGNMI